MLLIHEFKIKQVKKSNLGFKHDFFLFLSHRFYYFRDINLVPLWFIDLFSSRSPASAWGRQTDDGGSEQPISRGPSPSRSNMASRPRNSVRILSSRERGSQTFGSQRLLQLLVEEKVRWMKWQSQVGSVVSAAHKNGTNINRKLLN